jgi:hypothetical protein
MHSDAAALRRSLRLALFIFFPLAAGGVGELDSGILEL